MIINDILIEANVIPKAIEELEGHLKILGKEIKQYNPKINHDAFLKRLRKDILSNDDKYSNFSFLTPYTPNDADPSYIRNANEPVFTISTHNLSQIEDELVELFIPDEGEPTMVPLFSKLHNAINDSETPTEIKNKLIPIAKKYEQGKFDLEGLKKELKVFSQIAAQSWKHDKQERHRVETEAPIIMKFKNGMMWVRLDSQEEMKREGDMMQNCISGYCPVGEGVDLTFGLRDKFNQEVELEDQTDDEAYDWLANWFAENDTDAQDFLSNKQEEEDLNGDAYDAVEEVLGMDEDEAFDWMHSQLIDADADMETGELISGHLIYSLRDKNGESHVAAEYDPNMDMDYVEPESALGKQNKEALDKYKPYIKALNNFFEEHPESFGPKGNTRDMPFHPDYDDDLERDEPAESVNEGDLIPNPANTVAIKTMSDGDFYNLSKYMGDLDKAEKTEFGSPDSAAVITFQDPEEAKFVLKRIKKHTGLDGDNVSGYEDPGDAGTWNDEEGKKAEEKPLSLLGHELKRMKHLAGI